MRNYELMILFDPNLPDEDKTTLLDKIRNTIAANQGKVIKTDQWGKRKLAYPIKKFQEALYVIVYFNLEPGNIANLESSIKFEERIIRYLLIIGSEKFTVPQEKLTKEEEKKEEE